MSHDRPLALTVAGSLMVLAVVGYALGAMTGLVGGGFYPTVIGGTTRIDGDALFIGYAPLVPIAAVLAREILYERSLRIILIGCAAWFTVAALDTVILGGIQMALAVAITGALAFVLVAAQRHRFADVRQRERHRSG